MRRRPASSPSSGVRKRASSSKNTATCSTDKAELHGRPAFRPLAIGPAHHRACGDHDRHPARGRHAARMVAGAVESLVDGSGRDRDRAAAGAAADRARLLPAGDARAERAGRMDRPPLGWTHARLHLRRPRHRIGALLDAVRGAADPQCLRGDRRSAAGGGGDACAPRRGAHSGQWRCRWRGLAF